MTRATRPSRLILACLASGALAGAACRSGGNAAGQQGSGGSVASSGGATGGAAAGGRAGNSAPGGAAGAIATGGSQATGGVGAGGATSDAGVGGAGDPTDAGAPLVEAFAAQALAIAATYTAWGRVDDELRWAPFLCRQPLPGVARVSDSNDATTHGQKLYSVFVKHREAYPAGPSDDQVVVKQSWTAEAVAGADAGFDPASYRSAADAGDHFYPYAKSDAGVFRAAAPAGLFVMFKVAPASPDTDDGWVYATVSPGGAVTSAGRVASCMACHEVATHERLFGVPESPTQ